jgi:hypothetical protein
MESSAYWMDPSLVRLGRHGEIVMERVRVYRKGAIGPAVADAEKIIFVIDPLGMRTKGRLIRRVNVSGAVLRPRMFFKGPASTKAGRKTDMDFRFALNLADCTVWGLNLGNMSGEVICDGETMSLKWSDASLLSGSLEGDVRGAANYSFADYKLAVNIDAEMDPHILIPLLNEVNMSFLVDLINRFEFTDMVPRFKLDVGKELKKGSSLNVKGDVWLRNLKYRDVNVMRADGAVDIVLSPDVATVVVDPLVLTRRREGSAEVGLTVDLKKKTIDFRGNSRMDPLALARMTGVFTEKFLDAFVFEGTTAISARGLVGYKDKSMRKVKGTVRAEKAYFKNLPLEDSVVKIRVDGISNMVDVVSGRMFSGDLKASVQAVTFPKNSEGVTNSMLVKWDLKNADFQTLMSSDVCGKSEAEYKGILESSGFIDGVPGDENRGTLEGQGRLKVRDGRVFMMPVFGGLSRYMTKIIPGLDFVLRQSDADIAFELADEKISFEEVKIKGNVISLNGKGTCTLKQELDFNVKVTLMKEHTVVGKLLQVLSYPVSKLFEFRLTGSLTKPEWYLENSSKDLLDKLGLSRRKRLDELNEDEEETE